MFRQIRKIGRADMPDPDGTYWTGDGVYYPGFNDINGIVGGGVIGGGGPAQIACDEGYEPYVDANGQQGCRLIGSVNSVKPTVTQNLVQVNPVTTNIPTTAQANIADSITNSIKSSPLIALGVAGFLVFLFTRKK